MKTATLERFVAELKTAQRLRIDLTRDFYTLSASEVEQVLRAADLHNYRKPRGANGSRGRYFFERLKRAAEPCDFNGFASPVVREWFALVELAGMNWGINHA